MSPDVLLLLALLVAGFVIPVAIGLGIYSLAPRTSAAERSEPSASAADDDPSGR